MLPSGRSFRLLAAVSLVAFLALPSRAAEQKEKTGSDLSQRLEVFSRVLDRKREEAHVPGLALCIVRGDAVVLAEGFGLRDVEKELPVTPETVFAIGSSTKAFTSAVICMLDQDGDLDLDDPVREHLAGFRLKDPEADSKVTIRDLLCHRTGLTRMGILWAGGTVAPEKILEYVPRAEPYRPFRKAFLYNNVMYLAAGMAAGSAAESDWHALIRDRVFAPLGIKASNTGIGYCFLANVTATPLQQGIIALVGEALLGDPASLEADEPEAAKEDGATPSPEELARYVGKYHFAPLDADLTVQIKDGRLAVDVPGQTLYVLKWPDEEGKWVFELTNEVAVSFELPEKGDAVAMTFYQSGMTFRSPRVSEQKDLPSVEEILALRGKAGLLVSKGPFEHFRETGTARFVHQGAAGRYEVLVSGDRVYRAIDLDPFGSIVTATNGVRAFSDALGTPIEELDGKLRRSLLDQHPAAFLGDWRRHWKTIEVAKKGPFHGRNAYTVNLESEAGTELTVYVDVENGRILGTRAKNYDSAIQFEIETRYEDYRKLDGIDYPFRAITVLPQSGDLVVQAEKVETAIEPPADDRFVLLEPAAAR